MSKDARDDPMAFLRGCVNTCVVVLIAFFLAVAVLFLLARYGLWPMP